VGRVEYQRPIVASQPVRLAPRPEFLAGREELLARLHAQLSAGDGAVPQMAVLCGLGGCGKTSVAVEYAYQHLGEFGVVWQFPAEEPAALAAGFGDLAAQLGARNLLDGGDPVAQVHAALAARPGDWLLVLDNAPSAAAVRDVLPPAGGGRVLVTSQDGHWPGGRVVEVPVLDREAAVGFLLARTGSADVGAAGELAAELDGLPLALEQAAAYMTVSGRDVPGYLELFRRRRRELLARGEAAGYGRQVSTTWALAFDQLQQSPSAAIELLRVLACCAPEQAPLGLLLRPRPELAGLLPAGLVSLLEDPLAADDAIATLRRFSLVSAPRDRLVSVHRLVQAVTVDQMDDDREREWRQAARAVIEAALTGDPQHPRTWPAYAALLPHAEVALPAESRGMSQIASFLGFSGSYAAARELSRQVASARQQVLGAEHPDTLDARASLANWTGEAGDAAAARDQYAAVLPVTERVLGAEHPGTLDARASLAYFTGEAGDAAGARDRCAALLPVIQRVSGSEHPDTVAVRANLAYWTGEAGDAAGARDQYAALLPVTERVLGADHPDTLTPRASLARFTGEAGNAAGARDQFAALLPVTERVLGAEHPDTLRARASLARWTGNAGNVAAARDQFAALLPVRERVSGAEHPGALDARASLAYFTGEAGDAEGARDQFAALLPIFERVLGAEHPDTVAVRAGLARWNSRAAR
jgi:hypothetical protein